MTRVTLELFHHRETAKARLVSRDGFEHHAHWIPKALCRPLAEGKYEVDRGKAIELGWIAPATIQQGRLRL